MLKIDRSFIAPMLHDKDSVAIVRAVLSLATDAAMLDECERGEDAAVARYRKALDAELQPALRPVIERQYDGVQRNRALVRALRDQLHRAA